MQSSSTQAAQESEASQLLVLQQLQQQHDEREGEHRQLLQRTEMAEATVRKLQAGPSPVCFKFA